MNLANSIRAKGLSGVISRAGMIGTRFGVTPRRMERALNRYLEITERRGVRPSLPITAAVLARHPNLVRRYFDRGVEFAIHGMVHGDYSQLGFEEQRESLVRAGALFSAAGIPFRGFRSPYLRYNVGTDEALRALGFRYHSSQAVAFSVLRDSDMGQRGLEAYQRALDYYSAADAIEVAVRPRDLGGLVHIPVAVPDDEIMVDRLRMDDPSQAAAWGAILDRTYERAELFTIQLHPERIFKSGHALGAVLDDARRRTPPVWMASLDEIATWWLARRSINLQISEAGPHRYRVEATGDRRATVFARDISGLEGTPWSDREVAIRGCAFDVSSQRKPIVGVSARTPKTLLAFLQEEGFPCEVAPNPQAFGVYLDVPDDHWREADVLAMIDSAVGPLVRLGRWPEGARSALAVTGDIDSLTLQDFAWRQYETSRAARRRHWKGELRMEQPAQPR